MKTEAPINECNAIREIATCKGASACRWLVKMFCKISRMSCEQRDREEQHVDLPQGLMYQKSVHHKQSSWWILKLLEKQTSIKSNVLKFFFRSKYTLSQFEVMYAIYMEQNWKEKSITRSEILTKLHVWLCPRQLWSYCSVFHWKS